ncbi:hypothetical protein RhiirA5_353131 [Rhizophagus irregularis]|uniref:Nucleotidyltransferase n=3 Tax=Rhizophagus irregularis TaxID=588596 RepID=U9T6Y1_RHIID|nr:hypothetical protein GLOIN_2v1730979 [Rhizophagus irregularis DAOM 181602=DAOM 197198]EXX58045.1 hypothetical protein RirG_201530 [Rhizophagus irregularis DAOM 197198w]PKC12304.1 hypothetical protein RhiirA5_353131 [Rhizophagus irregularis]PKC61226.1 hypothetical protein RhiirA1_425085 [Rhizophagus irregularis]PKY31310.1 hypothetical protein RhiirB3_419430 [Rhizophagus irregularis]PKY54541.1 hypothetical protein RhiirA4_409864 [Rhizophagus irregularis]|eukprot:XP_025165287.1 hypothetical protein GLOIN_2v1730979 [Rhizophagus irregularis DAOM 181602=DAOM 197198]
MSPIFDNPFKNPSSKYLVPLMRFLNLPTKTTTSSLSSTTGNGKPPTKTNDCIYAKILVKLTQEFGDDLLGLFAYGSRIYGNACPHSDVDVDVFIKSQRKCRRNIFIDGLEVEMFIHPPEHVFHILTYDSSGIILRCYTFGRIIYDPNNIIPQLQKLAKLRWEAGPPALEPKDNWRPRYEIADLLRDLEDSDFVRDEATAHFLLVKLVERLARIQERLCRRWPEKLKRCIEGWESWDSFGGRLAKRALNSNLKWAERLRCARDLAKYVLEPIGGVMPIEWKMDWEEIPPAEESFRKLIIPKIEVFISS